MTRAILALLVSAVLTTQAHAQAAPSPVDHWDASLLIDTLHGLGATDVRADTAATDARPTIIAVTRDGLTVILTAKGCDTAPSPAAPSCHALEAVIAFDVKQKSDRVALADQLNHEFAIGKFTVEPDGALRASRYLLLDGGVTQDNLRQELIDFFTVGLLTRQTLWPQTTH